MVPVRIVIALALVGAVACTGGEPVARPSGPAAEKAARRAVAAAADPALRIARLEAGSDVESGSLARFCTGTRCTSDPNAEPSRFLEVPENGLLLFVVAQEPERGRVDVRHRASGKRVMARTLPSGTVMPLQAHLRDGSYLVRFRATWEGKDATWVFGVRA